MTINQFFSNSLVNLMPSTTASQEVIAVIMASIPQMPQEASIRNHMVHLYCFLINFIKEGVLENYLLDSFAHLPDEAKLWLVLYSLLRDGRFVKASLSRDHYLTSLDYRVSKHLHAFNKRYSKFSYN
jgi:hypothetical protein